MCLSVCLSFTAKVVIYLLYFDRIDYLSICLSVCLSFPSKVVIYLLYFDRIDYLSIYLSVCLSVFSFKGSDLSIIL